MLCLEGLEDIVARLEIRSWSPALLLNKILHTDLDC
jgi:hypothetical protein